MYYHKKCTVLGCTSTGMKLRAFPLATNKERFLKWLRACGNVQLLKLSERQLRHKVVCDLHFETKVKLASTLSRVAVPTLFLPKPIDVSSYKFDADKDSDADTKLRDYITVAELLESEIEGSEEEISEQEQNLNVEQECDNAEQDAASLSDNSELNNRVLLNEDVYIGRNGLTEWRKMPCASESVTDLSPEEHVAQSSSHCSTADKKPCEIENELCALREFIDKNMLDEIITGTNLLIKRRRLSRTYSRCRDLNETTRTELLAVFGLLYLVGMKRASHTNLLELWADDGTGLEICRSTMNYRRFLFLLDCLRFDNKSTRLTRLKEDKLASIRNIWNRFVENCKKSYSPSGSLVIGDRLKSFQGKCSFIQHMPDKPAKYGLKIISLVDAKTSFTCNIELYCGQQPEGPYRVENDPAAIVHRLLQHIKGSPSNVTCDDRYTTYPLAVSLLDDNITFLGAMGRAHDEVPACFLSGKWRPVGNSCFGFRDDATLVSHVTEKGKAIVVLSTMHRQAEINPRTNVPAIIEEYNAAKDAVDVVEQTCATYSVSKMTKRWPLAAFFALLDIAGLNAQILYNTSQRKIMQKCRRGFLKNLALALLKPHLQERAKIKNIPLNIQTTVLNNTYENSVERSSNKRSHETDEEVDEEETARKMGPCFLCGRRKITRTAFKCSTCLKFTCKGHITCTKYTCEKCDENTVCDI
nr:PREDICTED: uncharacterized protein LOC105676739 [Linepithema humile]